MKRCNSLSIKELKLLIANRKILLLAPGASLTNENEKIKKYITDTNPIIISVNFVSEAFNVDFAFFSNGKRFVQLPDYDCKLILTSNIDSDAEAYRVNYNRLSGAFSQGYNSMVMAMKLLVTLGVDTVAVAN